MTNRENLLQEINKNPDEFLFLYNCKVVNYIECYDCVVFDRSDYGTKCEEPYKEWLDKEAKDGMTNREKLVREFNENPDEFLCIYNCFETGKFGERYVEAYKEWLDEEAKGE